jgi:carbon-monoxide dehydrogenase medium subunit
VGHPPTRTRGTLGGSFAQADPVAELPGVAVALDAVFVIEGPAGTREVPASEFFIAPLTTAIARGELLREVRFPFAPNGARAAFVESGNRRHDLAIAGIAAQVVVGPDGMCSEARLAAIGVGERPVRLSAAEAALKGRRLDDATVSRAADAAVSGIDAYSNTVASAGYRRKLVAALTGRALRAVAHVH